MMNCPHCQKPISQIEIEDVPLAVLFQPQYKGFAYLCPGCRKVLSVGMNPLSLEDDLVARIANRVADLLRK